MVTEIKQKEHAKIIADYLTKYAALKPKIALYKLMNIDLFKNTYSKHTVYQLILAVKHAYKTGKKSKFLPNNIFAHIQQYREKRPDIKIYDGTTNTINTIGYYLTKEPITEEIHPVKEATEPPVTEEMKLQKQLENIIFKLAQLEENYIKGTQEYNIKKELLNQEENERKEFTQQLRIELNQQKQNLKYTLFKMKQGL